MRKYKKLSHVIYYHEYHIVWTPKYRFKILEGPFKGFVEESIVSLCEWKKVEILEMNVQKDHIHMIVSIPPKISVSQFMWIIKGKTGIKVFRSFPVLQQKPYWGNHFWSRGYCSSTIGLDEEKIKKYVKYQDEHERQEDKQQLGIDF